MQLGLWWPRKLQLMLAVHTAAPEPASLLSLHICGELPLAWNTKKASTAVMCSPPARLRDSGFQSIWPISSTNLLLNEKELPQTASLNHKPHVSRTKGIFISLCTSLTFFFFWLSGKQSQGVTLKQTPGAVHCATSDIRVLINVSADAPRQVKVIACCPVCLGDSHS